MKAHLIPIIWAIVICTAQHLTGLDDVMKNAAAKAAAPVVECSR